LVDSDSDDDELVVLEVEERGVSFDVDDDDDDDDALVSLDVADSDDPSFGIDDSGFEAQKSQIHLKIASCSISSSVTRSLTDDNTSRNDKRNVCRRMRESHSMLSSWYINSSVAVAVRKGAARRGIRRISFFSLLSLQ